MINLCFRQSSAFALYKSERKLRCYMQNQRIFHKDCPGIDFYKNHRENSKHLSRNNIDLVVRSKEAQMVSHFM